MVTKRGVFIVIEGADRTGKTTQCKLLVKHLTQRSIPAEYMNFPNRTTEIGKVIDSYLTSKKSLPDEAIHLLFSANRWEKASSIKTLLDQGISIIMDRYCYSGVAFSSAKGLDIKWCKSSDAGLPKPDKVFFLNMPLENVENREGFGNERYEVMDFQQNVMKKYMQLKEDNWEIIDANRSQDVVLDELIRKVIKILDNEKIEPLSKLWV